MPDSLTLLENKLDEHYKEHLLVVETGEGVVDWADYTFRIGYLRAVREVGELIKEVRAPEKYAGSKDIPDILQEINHGG